jgi:hypothetical protein
MTMVPDTSPGVDPDPLTSPGSQVHLSLPVSMSTAKRPPRPVGLPARMALPATVAGPQSRKPAFTVNFSVGAVRSGRFVEGSDCANPANGKNAAATTATPHQR